MNVLLFVTSLLLILSLLTYARIDNFRYFLGMQSEFERYMSTVERSHINQTAKQWYDRTIANSRTNSPSQQTPTQTTPPTDGSEPTSEHQPVPGAAGTSRLSLRTILDPDLRSKNEQADQQTLQWIKDLMRVLYGQQPFFKEMMQKRPTFLDDILAGMAAAINAIPKDKRVWKAEELSNLNLGPELEEAYYLMLKGCVNVKNELSAAPQPPPVEFVIDTEAGKEDETDPSNEATEYSSAESYSSLLNYITLKNTTKVRVYLASRPLLIAIFGQASVADSIIQTRSSLYRSVMNGMAPEEATNQFKASFQAAGKGDADTFLDFKVTKTNPSEYN
jgi:hypothetical protein